ncbi:MAG: cyclic nucleotide-binding domain-containing protein [Candidatus Sumerlaeaceae bacterium]|nr:cyclic nucleotide-binding domain-containing protein [Candidatus Sumerlaeaceae bacterium]
MKHEETGLKNHPFLAGADPALIKAMAAHAKPVRMEEGAVIYREGAESAEFYLIEQGRVALEVHTPSRGPMVIETLESGDLLGWSWAVPPFRKSFDARALEPTRAIAFDATAIRNLMEQNPALGYELLKRVIVVMAQRLQSTRIRLLDIFKSP